jgi:hypothetical protein
MQMVEALVEFAYSKGHIPESRRWYRYHFRSPRSPIKQGVLHNHVLRLPSVCGVKMAAPTRNRTGGPQVVAIARAGSRSSSRR